MGKMIIAMVIAVALISTALAVEKKCDSVSKAEALWDYNMKPEALACLDEIIQTDPTNTKAHFLKGKMCLATGNNACAKERFSAEPVRAKHGNEIAEFYKSVGDVKLNSGTTKEAEGFYREASLYRPSVSKEVAKELFTKGAQIGNDNFLYLAGRLDSSLNKAIGEYYHSLSKSAPRKEDQIDLLGKAASFDNTVEKEYTENREAWGRFHLEEGKKWAKVPGKEQVTDDHRQAARKYLGDAVVESELPEVREYNRGTYVFTVKTGEQTPHWITFSIQGKYNISSMDYNYEINYDDGEKIKDGANVSYPKKYRVKFKIIALTDQEIKMTVK